MSGESSSESDHGPSRDTMHILLVDSLKREIELKRLLQEQVKKNDELQIQLEMEKKNKSNSIIVEASSDESEKSVGKASMVNAPIGDGVGNNFGSNSSILMEYKYTELQQSYSKCVQKLYKRGKQTKKLLREVEMEKFKNAQLMTKNAELNDKVEQVCFRFFKLLDRRSEEQLKMQSKINELNEKLADRDESFD